MPLLPGELIEAARGVHPAFAPERTPARALVEWLSGWQRRLVGLTSQRNSAAIVLPLEVALPLDDHDAGVELPPRHYLRPGSLYDERGQVLGELMLVPYDHRHHYGAGAVYVLGDTLFLCGAASAWQRVARLTLQYTPVPELLQGLEDPLLLPDSAEAAAVAALAYRMALRAPADAGVPAAALRDDAAAAEAAYLDMIGAQRRAQTIRTREVW